MAKCRRCRMRAKVLARTREDWEQLCNWHWLRHRTGDLRIVLPIVQV